MENYNRELIQVLWVEDDPKIIEAYPLKAETFDLQLVSFSCWDDAKIALENEFDRWSAIILDAKCKYHKSSEDNAVVFLREALKDISVICQERKRVIPWYVLTGGDISEVSDSINDDRLKWDADWTHSKNKKYYSKNTDNDMLWSRIRYHASISQRMQIQKLYKDVFDAIKECGIDVNAKTSLEDLLEPIHFPEVIRENDYNAKFEQAREILEYIFRSMARHGILPEWGRQVNLQWSSCILSGMNACRKDNEGKDIIVIESYKTIVAPSIQKILREMVGVIPAFCHSDNNKDDEIKKTEYLQQVDYSTFLLKSFSLQLCDLILWYKNYLKGHPNVDDNKTLWKIKAPHFLRF